MQLQHLLKTATVLSIMAFSLGSRGQTFYTFSKTTEPYSEISGQIVTNTFTQNSYQVNLGVPVKMFDQQAGTSFNVGVNGFIVATGPQYSFATDPFTVGLKKIDNTSSISATAQLTTDLDTVFIIQWKNLKPDSAEPGDYINMQCKLYLKSQTIEFHYGPNTISNNKLNDSALEILTGVFLLSTDFTISYENQRVYGPCNNPSIQPDPNVVTSLLGFPANGTVYRFTRKSGVGIKENIKPAFSVYPNPVNDRVYIQLAENEIKNVKITTITGQLLYNGNYNSGGIDVSGLAPGLYTVTVTNNNGDTNTTLLKK